MCVSQKSNYWLNWQPREPAWASGSLREPSGAFGSLREPSGTFGNLREPSGTLCFPCVSPYETFGNLREPSGTFENLREPSGPGSLQTSREAACNQPSKLRRKIQNFRWESKKSMKKNRKLQSFAYLTIEIQKTRLKITKAHSKGC